jgi:hypothetical protein
MQIRPSPPNPRPRLHYMALHGDRQNVRPRGLAARKPQLRFMAARRQPPHVWRSSDSAPGRRNKARTTWGQTKCKEWRLSGRRRAASPLVRLLSDSSPKAEPRKNHHGRDERPYPKGQVACRRVDLRLESRSCDSWLPGGSHSMPGARPTPLREEGTKRASALVPEDRHQAQNAVLTVLP